MNVFPVKHTSLKGCNSHKWKRSNATRHEASRGQKRNGKVPRLQPWIITEFKTTNRKAKNPQGTTEMISHYSIRISSD